jgi:PTH1 family peptidyl-tRNA hydrolase
VIWTLQTDRIARLRCGIGRGDSVPGNELADYVLSPFSEEEADDVTAMVTRAADAVETFIQNGIDDAMKQYNT